MTRHLTDKETITLIGDYVYCKNYSAIARKYKISRPAVKKIILRNPDLLNKAEQKKEQIESDMMLFIESRVQKAICFINAAFEQMMQENKLQQASLKELAISLGIIVDKFTKYTKTAHKGGLYDELLRKITGRI